MKYCKVCKKERKTNEFIRNGKEYKSCNPCHTYKQKWTELDRQNNPDKWDKRKEKDRLKKQKYRDEFPGENKINREKYASKNPEKLKAYDADRMQNRPEYFLFSSARMRARKRGIKFDITELDVKILLDTTPICLLRMVKFERGNDGKPIDNSRTLDRIDSSKGYTKNNIQIISYRANVVKSDIDLKIFNKIITGLKKYKIVEHDITDETMKIIIRDREKEIENRGITKSCDIYRFLFIEKWLINSAKKRSKKKGLDITIDAQYIRSIWPLDNKCPILGKKFENGKNFIMSNYSATLDRIDNNKGYVQGNVRIISAKANSVKQNCSINDLEFMLKNWKNLKNRS